MQNIENTNAAVERQREHFNALSDEYFAATQHPNCLAFNRFIWRYLLKRHPHIVRSGAAVLEPMCGHGIAKEHLEAAFDVPINYTGFDYSPALVEIAKARMPDAYIFVQDVTSFGASQQYDIIFLSGGLHHVYGQTTEVLKRLHAALKPGGYMLSAEPTYDNPVYREIGEFIYKRNHRFDAGSEQRYALSELNAHYGAAGFSIIDQIYPGLLAYIIAVSAFCFPRLCVGTPQMIERLACIESMLYRTILARKLSFSTITLLQRGGA